MQLKKWSWALCVLQWLIYGVCVIDGICIARGLTFLGMVGGPFPAHLADGRPAWDEAAAEP